MCLDIEVQSEWIFIGRGYRRASTSTDGRRRPGTSTAEGPGENLHRRSVTAGSTHRRERIKEKIFIGSGFSRTSTSTDGGREVRTINIGDPGEDLHRRSVTAGSTRRRERIKDKIFIGRGSRRASTSTDGGRELREINSVGSRRAYTSTDGRRRLGRQQRRIQKQICI